MSITRNFEIFIILATEGQYSFILSKVIAFQRVYNLALIYFLLTKIQIFDIYSIPVAALILALTLKLDSRFPDDRSIAEDYELFELAVSVAPT